MSASAVAWLPWVALGASIVCAPAISAAEEPGPIEDDAMPTIEVVGVAPVLGAGVESDRVAASVRRVDSDAVEDQKSAGLHRALNARVAGITVNEVQNNPLQPDVSFRGYTLSPLLGVPQGIAVYQNGTRVNEPFGDVVQWDVIPEFAIDEVEVTAGANPVYGLNALGGTLALKMKHGWTFDGVRAGALGGSFGRYQGVIESGGRRGEWGIYAAGDVWGEGGWRDHSDSFARRLYADVRRRTARSEVAFNLSAARTELRGNGPAPRQLLERRRDAIFTHPDITENAAVLLAVQTETGLSDAAWLQTNVYYRPSVRRTLNADEAELEPCATAPAVLCDDEGDPALGESGSLLPASAGGDGVINTTRTGASGYGASVQVMVDADLMKRENRLVAGISVDQSDVRFDQRTEIGALTADRGVAGSGFHLGGEGRTALEVLSTSLGLYATDTFALLEDLFLTLSGRLNLTRVDLDDRLGTELDGTHDFARLNPAVGLAYRVAPGAKVYAFYSEANRAPTAAELSCADPAEPCRVPNAFLSDPPLDQVVARAVELGAEAPARLGPRAKLHVAGAIFASRNFDDILFISGERIGTGFFQNAGTTQRVGTELLLSAEHGLLDWYAGYQFLLATFESDLQLPGVAHPNATTLSDGRRVITVEPGDSLPGIPAHSVKAGIGLRPIDTLRFSLSSIVQSSQVYRGDESNQLEPLPGYIVLAAGADYRVLRELSVFVRVENVLDTDYETFGVLGDGSEVLPFATDPRFVGPAPPLGVWAGADVRFD